MAAANHYFASSLLSKISRYGTSELYPSAQNTIS